MLWSISRTLFATAVGYAVLGSVIAVVLGRPLVRLNYDQSDREADFRAHLIHVRENAESVALLHREPHIGARLRGHVDALTANLKRIIAVNRNLSFFTTGYDYLIQIIPVLIVAPLFIRGETEFGTIPQSSMAFAHVLGAFSLVVKQFPQLSTYAAVLARLSALASATEAAAGAARGRIAIVEDRDAPRVRSSHALRSPNDGRHARPGALLRGRAALASLDHDARRGRDDRAPARSRRDLGERRGSHRAPAPGGRHASPRPPVLAPGNLAGADRRGRSGPPSRRTRSGRRSATARRR